jgi:hypothetical protein
VVDTISNTPRFGHGSSFEDVLSSDSQTQKSYVIGITFAAIICISVFVVWAVLLLVFMCCGTEKVGFLSGRPFRLLVASSSSPSSTPQSGGSSGKRQGFGGGGEEEESSPHEAAPPTKRWSSSRDSAASDSGAEKSAPHRNPSCGNRPTRIRVAFLVCGAAFVTFSVLVVTEGLSNLQSTVAVMQGSTKEVMSITNAAIDILENEFLRAGTVAESVRTELDQQLAEGAFCPRDPSLENTAEGQQLRSAGVNALDQLDALGDFMTTNVQLMLEPLKEFANQSAYVDEKLAPIDLTDWRAMVILIPFSIVPALLMGGALMALFDASVPAYVCFTNWFLLPVFVLLVVVAWAVASAMLVLAALNGDFCLPSGYYEGNPPDGTVRSILKSQGYANTTAYAIADFYVTQCQRDDPFDFVYDARPQLQDAEVNLLNVAKLLNAPNFLSTLSLYCNRDYSSLQEMVNNMDTLVELLDDGITRTLDLIRCDRIVPIYTETIYQGVCTYSPSAVFWVFSSCLIMGVAGMLMVTFRSSLKMTLFGYDVEDDNADGLVLQDEGDMDNYEPPRSGSGIAASDPNGSGRLHGSNSYGDDVYPENYQQRADGQEYENNNFQPHPSNGTYSQDYMNEEDRDPAYDFERQWANQHSFDDPAYDHEREWQNQQRYDDPALRRQQQASPLYD